MQRIDTRTVELTDAEVLAWERYQAHLDQGLGIPLAAKLALNRHFAETHTMPGIHDDRFISYLSEDTCIRRGSRVQIRPEWQDPS